MSQCDKSLCAGFNPITTWQHWAATPLQPAQGHCLQLRYIVANILWRNDQTISITIKYAPLSYRTGGNRKRSEQSMNAVHKSLETVFSIAICRQSGDKRQSKTLFLTILDLRSSIVLTFTIAAYLKCLLNIGLLNTQPNQSKTMATMNNLLSGYTRQSKTLFLMILDLRCRYYKRFRLSHI